MMKSGRIYKVVNLIENGKRKLINKKDLNNNKILSRKKIPKHGITQVHKNKKKSDKYWDSDFEEQCRELYGDNMP